MGGPAPAVPATPPTCRRTAATCAAAPAALLFPRCCAHAPGRIESDKYRESSGSCASRKASTKGATICGRSMCSACVPASAMLAISTRGKRGACNASMVPPSAPKRLYSIRLRTQHYQEQRRANFAPRRLSIFALVENRIHPVMPRIRCKSHQAIFIKGLPRRARRTRRLPSENRAVTVLDDWPSSCSRGIVVFFNVAGTFI